MGTGLQHATTWWLKTSKIFFEEFDGEREQGGTLSAAAEILTSKQKKKGGLACSVEVWDGEGSREAVKTYSAFAPFFD